MNAESLVFLRILFARTSVGAIALTALPKAGGGVLTGHVPLAQPALLTEAVARLQQRNTEGAVHAFVGIATRRPGLSRYQRGGKADLLELPALFADIDRTPAEAYPSLARFRLSPSLIVASGFGMHLYWLLEEPAMDLPQCVAILAELAKMLGGDRLTVAQSMRLPGTQNPKIGRGPCSILKSEPYRRYALSEFAAILPAKQNAQRYRTAIGTSLGKLARDVSDALITY